jgi:hypothetical protein
MTNMKIIRFYDIDWCIDSDETDVNFPTEIILKINFSDDESVEVMENDIEENGDDYLSEEIGLLVTAYSYEIL